MGAGASSASKTDLKATCGLLKTRCGVVRRKELEVSHQARREVVELLQKGDEDRARFACTKVVLEDYKIEMIDAVEFCADSLHQRAAALVNGGKEPDEYLAPHVATVQHVDRHGLLDKVPELKLCAKQLASRYSSAWNKRVNQTPGEIIPPDLYRLFESARAPPDTELILVYLSEIAKANDIELSNRPTVKTRQMGIPVDGEEPEEPVPENILSKPKLPRWSSYNDVDNHNPLDAQLGQARMRSSWARGETAPVEEPSDPREALEAAGLGVAAQRRLSTEAEAERARRALEVEKELERAQAELAEQEAELAEQEKMRAEKARMERERLELEQQKADLAKREAQLKNKEAQLNGMLSDVEAVADEGDKRRSEMLAALEAQEAEAKAKLEREQAAMRKKYAAAKAALEAEAKKAAAAAAAAIKDAEKDASRAIKDAEKDASRAAQAAERAKEQAAKAEREAAKAKQEKAALKAQMAESMPPAYWAKAKPENTKDGFALVSLDIARDKATWQALEKLLPTNPNHFRTGRDADKSYPKYDKLRLVSAWRVEHPGLWSQFQAAQKQVELQLTTLKKAHVKQNPGSRRPNFGSDLPGELNGDVNESILLHGAPPSVLFSILATGLNERYSGTNAGSAYGDGNYLAEDVGKCDQYSEVDDNYTSLGSLGELHQRLYPPGQPGHQGKVFYVLVCRVALGHHARTNTSAITVNKTTRKKEIDKDLVKSMDDGQPLFPISFRELAAVQANGVVRYHSLYVDVMPKKNYNEWVVFHSELIYPEYVIAYQRWNGSKGPV